MTHKEGSHILRALLPLVSMHLLALVAMAFWRIGAYSGLMFGTTVMMLAYAVLIFIRRPYHVGWFVTLLAAGIGTIWVFGAAASHAEIEAGTSIRQIDTPARLVFLANVCVYSTAVLAPIWTRRYRKNRAKLSPMG